MAYLDTYTPITVSNSRGFNDVFDGFQPQSQDPAYMQSYQAASQDAAINMTGANGRSLSDLLKGFDEPGPPPVTPGTFVRAIEADANAWGDAFGQTIQQAQHEAASYWATPAAPVSKAPSASERVSNTADGLANKIGGFADGLAGALTGVHSEPAMPEVGVEMSSLKGSFGQLSQSEPSAFERRYQQPTTRKPGGSDYV